MKRNQRGSSTSPCATLCDVKPGEDACIALLEDALDPVVRRRLGALGFREGEQVTCLRAPRWAVPSSSVCAGPRSVCARTRRGPCGSVRWLRSRWQRRRELPQLHRERRGNPGGHLEVALLGSPNTGKSSLFNRLTGLSAATGNYPGVTVTRSRGTARTPSGSVTVTDLPGTYSLEPASPDEEVVLDHLHGRLDSDAAPDALLVVMDSTTLYRSLGLCAEALALGRPTAVVLTMVDELRARGGTWTSRRSPARSVYRWSRPSPTGAAVWRRSASCWVAPPTGPWPSSPPCGEDAQLSGWIRSVLDSAQYRAPWASVATSRIDRVLLHPVWGTLVFLAVMFCFFQVIFTVAAPIQDAIQAVFDHWGELGAQTLGSGFAADFVGTALIGGVGGVLVFLPQILLLYLMISILESVGYMSRAAFLMDRIMARSGLDGALSWPCCPPQRARCPGSWPRAPCRPRGTGSPRSCPHRS